MLDSGKTRGQTQTLHDGQAKMQELVQSRGDCKRRSPDFWVSGSLSNAVRDVPRDGHQYVAGSRGYRSGDPEEHRTRSSNAKKCSSRIFSKDTLEEISW